MIKENKVFIGIGLFIILFFVLGIVFTSKYQSSTLEPSGDARIEVLSEKIHDWGQIDIEGGNVEKTFQIKNSGDSDLEITNIKTSCLCTETQIDINGDKSPVFGMHTRSGWKGVIKPGDSAEVRVVFDPLFHGPQGTGPITRLVSLDTNDVANRTIEFRLSGNVVRLDN